MRLPDREESLDLVDIGKRPHHSPSGSEVALRAVTGIGAPQLPASKRCTGSESAPVLLLSPRVRQLQFLAEIVELSKSWPE